jgi:hypothetical protein
MRASAPRSHRIPRLLAVVLAAGSLGLPDWKAAGAADSGKISFNRQIRPILSGSCFYCHGPDEKHREAKLRLDTREGALAEHDGVRAIVPGKPEQSELLTRILSHDKDEVMPPPSAKKPRFTEAEVALLRRWIEEGAPYEGHWAFLPLQESAPPAPPTPLSAWVRNGVDPWIVARLQKEGLSPSPEADRPTLIRRASLDLTGLLPSPEEVKAFAADPDPAAYEKLVDRLLASPHYGERWGRHWLDQARYADTNGYTIDGERSMWPYRDWVIRALNDDKPFDQFTIEQLAGDLLPSPAKAQLIATAFHRNTLINQEGGTKPEQFRVEAVIDRVNTTGAVWLGLTLGCAQCHTHKFDPIAQREYYQMYAFFNQGVDVNNTGPTLDVARDEVFERGPTAEELRAKALAAAAANRNQWEEKTRAQLLAEQAEQARQGEQGGTWSPAKYMEYQTANNAGFRLLEDNSLLADGGASFNDRYRVVVEPRMARIGAVRLRVLTHESLPKQGPGLAGNGNFVLTKFTASLGGQELPIRSARADHEQPGYPASAAIDEAPKTGWAINVAKGASARMNANHEIVFVFEKPIEPAGAPLEFHLHHDLNENYLIGRFALDLAEKEPGTPSGVAPKPKQAWEQALLVDAAQRSAAQKKLITEAFEAANKVQTKKDPNVAELMVMKDVEAAKARPTYLLKRGDFLQPDEKAGTLNPGVLSAVQESMGKESRTYRTRLELAQWLVDPKNPLTPRVTVNRVWMRYFGRGIVETEEDFGSQGSAPTHPELLDWLAREFIRSGWSMKQLHRTIVNSATYRQSSAARPDLAEKDPRNLLLARQERLRVEAEILRDAALSASGLLDRTVGGPGVKPPQPAGVYSFTQGSRPWVVASGGDRYRRGLYTTFIRSAPHPLFTTFDTPDFQQVCTRRARSNTPLQALTMANDEAFFEMAQGLALRVLREAGADSGEPQWLERAAWLCLGRPPSDAERRILGSYFTKQREAYEAQGGALPDALLGPGLKKQPVPPAKAAALVSVSRVLLNTDAFVTRE